MSDWYSVSRTEIEKRGGRGLLRKSRDLPDLLQSVFPDFPWKRQLFARRSRVIGTDRLLEALDRAAQQLGIQQVRFSSPPPPN